MALCLHRRQHGHVGVPDGQVPYQMTSNTEAARSTPIVTLNTRQARADRSRRGRTAPKASQGRQLGSDTSAKVSPNAAAWLKALPAPWSRKVAAALAPTSHDFGLSH